MANVIVNNTRTFQKRGTEANWNLVNDFIPGDGELLIYEPDANHPSPRMKVGNGVDLPRNLPFIVSAVAARVEHKLTFGADGEYQYDGSEDVTVPVYDGSYNVN